MALGLSDGPPEKLLPYPPKQLRLVDHVDAELLRFLQLAAGVGAGHDEAGLLGDAAGHAAAVRFDELRRLLAREPGQRPREDDRAAFEALPLAACGSVIV